MIALAPILLLIGVALVGFSFTGLRAARQHAVPGPTRQRIASIPCGLPSPDYQEWCAGDAGHEGWCHDGSSEWHGDVYNIDHWAQTQERTALALATTGLGLEPTTAKARPEDGTVKVLLRPTKLSVPQFEMRWGVMAIVAAVGVTILVNVMHDNPGPQRANCAAQWITAAPGHPLCASSPDRNLTGDQLLQKYCVGADSRMICNDKTIGVPKEMNR